MAAKKGSRVLDSWKQKRWYKIVAPAMFGSKQLGETVAAHEEDLIGRTARVSLMNVLGDSRKQNISATFEIVKVNNGTAETQLKKFQLVPASIRRMIRKGKDRIDLSIVCATRDNQIIRIKPLIVTRGSAGNSAIKAIRKLAEDLVRVEVSKAEFNVLAKDIVYGAFQKKIRQRLSKIYPLRSLEIRVLEKSKTNKPLPPIPKIEEVKTEVKETETEKIEKKVKANTAPTKKEVKEALSEGLTAKEKKEAEKK